MSDIRFTNFARSTLAVGVTSGDTILALAGGGGAAFPALVAGQYFYATLEDAQLNREIVRVTGRTVDSLLVVRGQDNTAARPWTASASVSLRLNAAAMQDHLTQTAASQTAAANSEATATNAATSATVSQTAAANSATTAGNSATAAAASQTAAGNSATNAAASATTAGNAATSATASQTAAANSATAAAGSATSAANSAADAAASAAVIDTANFVQVTGDQTIGGVKTFTDAPVVPGLNGGQLAGMRNLLINGNFQVNQRGYVSGTATTVANQYTLDRWRVVTSGQDLPFSTSGNGNQITAPAGGIEQIIEGINIFGGTYVLSWNGTATATVNGVTRANGESFTLATNTNATVRLIGGTASLVQLEPGTVATPFEHRPIGAELALCQRYYQRLRMEQRFAASAAETLTVTRVFVVPMRATPSFVLIAAGASVNATTAQFVATSANEAQSVLSSAAAGDCFITERVFETSGAEL